MAPLSWPMPVAATNPPGVAEAGTPGAVGSAIDVGIPAYYTEDDFLAMVDRLFPDWYIEPLKEGYGPGYELIQAYAALFSRVSLAVGRFEVSNYLMFASGGASSVASVEFYRTSLGTGSFTIKAGTVVKASASNRQYVLVADVAFGSGDYYKGALVSSIGLGKEFDVPGPLVTADNTLLPGEIDTVLLPILVPVFQEPSLRVRQSADATGGSAPVLDQICADRGIDRLNAEADAQLKRRGRQLPDTVSPAGIRRQLDAAFFVLGLPYELQETWQHSYQSCWDAPLGTITHPQQGTLLEGTFAYDDPRDDRFSGRWMDQQDCPSGYVLTVPRLPCLLDRGMAYDDPAETFVDIRSSFGKRADSAWDSPGPDGPLYVSGCWDGPDTAASTVLASVYDLFKRIKGGGINVAMVQAGAGQTELTVPVTFPPLPVTV